jgi:HEAT repeat protein
MGPAAKPAKEPLEKLLKGESKFAAILAAVALVDLDLATESDTDAIVVSLTTGLKDEHPRVRVAAAESLGKMGPKAKSAAGALEAATKDSEERVAAAAQEALAKVNG